MRGSNTLTLNMATMIEALQEYFDKRTTEAGKFVVKHIKASQINASLSIEVVVEQPPLDLGRVEGVWPHSGGGAGGPGRAISRSSE